MFSRRPGFRFNRGRVPAGGVPVSAPTLSSIVYATTNVAQGDILGNYTLTLAGSNLTGATVSIGGNSASVLTNNGSTITATAPAHSAGAVDVSVTTPGGTSTLTNGFEYVSLLALTPTGLYFGDNYSNGTWTDTSGNTRNLTEATNKPTLNTADLNGLNTVSFNGSDQKLATALAIDQFVAVGAHTIYMLLNVTSVTNNSATAYLNDFLWGDTAQFLGGFLRNNGPTVLNYNWDGNADAAAVSISTGAWVVVGFRHKAGNLGIRVGTGAWTEVASGDSIGGSNALQLGGLAASGWFTGKMAAVAFYNTALSDANDTKALSAIYTKYAL